MGNLSPPNLFYQTDPTGTVMFAKFDAILVSGTQRGCSTLCHYWKANCICHSCTCHVCTITRSVVAVRFRVQFGDFELKTSCCFVLCNQVRAGMHREALCPFCCFSDSGFVFSLQSSPMIVTVGLWASLKTFELEHGNDGFNDLSLWLKVSCKVQECLVFIFQIYFFYFFWRWALWMVV